MQHSRRTDRQVVEAPGNWQRPAHRDRPLSLAKVVGQFSETAEGCVTGKEEVVALVGLAIRVREIVVAGGIGAEIADPVGPRGTGE